MICKQSRNFSAALFFSFNSLRRASFRSKTNPKAQTTLPNRVPKSTSYTNPLAGGDRRTILSAIPSPSAPSDSTAASIVSLLSEPSDIPLDLDFQLQNFKNKLTSDIVLRILRNYKQLGRSRTLEFFSWAGFQLEFRFDDAVVEYMTDFLGRRKLFDDLKWLLKTAASRRGGVSTRSVAISIRFLGRQGRIMEALALFEGMELEFFCRPDNLVFNNILYVLCRKDPHEDSMDAALLIFRQMGQPDEFSYSNILIGLSRFGRFEIATQIFHEMSRAHLIPTRTAANILIKQFCESGGKRNLVEKVRVTSFRNPFEILVPCVRAESSIESAVELFWAIFELNLVPSGHVINSLITELSHLQKFEEAFEILKMVGDRKLRCGDKSYMIVIQELCKICRADEASGLFEKMLSVGFKPKVAGYNSLIQMFCSLRHVEEAKKYFDLMKKKRCEPDHATYYLLINAYSEVRSWEAAYEMVMEMMDMGWNPNFDLCRVLGGILRENGRNDLVLKMERNMEIQLLHGDCKAGRVDAAYEKLKGMLSKGFYPPIYVKDAFEKAFRKAGKWKIASQILSEMDQFAIQKND
ncbi:pentatricopeptide repeat-containing protein At3g53700, chloroplastic-like [Phalaenopsis equestris]|uniref:pentatricopeptide repeat-containing protein At3g53700, chloroplastic-like n=1 Tax=Phalaenopsis equestris TaxID=78828 RepID=UPI0009E593C0|nr:pentatricopeptide repeat-containing protein At3g53700, chloroplastic-like [Phalaenopsis equestris]